MKRARIDLRVPEADKARWAAAADQRGLELSELIRRAVPFYLVGNPAKRRKKAA